MLKWKKQGTSKGQGRHTQHTNIVRRSKAQDRTGTKEYKTVNQYVLQVSCFGFRGKGRGGVGSRQGTDRQYLCSRKSDRRHERERER